MSGVMVERLVPWGPEWAEFSPHHLARYLFAADFARDRRVLDAGAGSGYGARLLRSAGASAVVGVDIDPEAVRLAQSQFGGDGVEFLLDDCQRLDRTTGVYDLVTNFENIEHLQDPRGFLAAAGRRLGPGGLLLVSSPDRAASPPPVDGRPRNQFHVVEWFRDEFEKLLREYFEDVDVRVQVESTSLRCRREAVAALREGMTWANPLSISTWRKWPFGSRRQRPWKQLAGFAAPSIGDYPILPAATAALFGTPAFHVAVCRQPRQPTGNS